MKKLNILILVISLIVLSCGDKKDKKDVEVTSVKLEELHIKQEIKALEAETAEIKNIEASIKESIKNLDEMFNEL